MSNNDSLVLAPDVAFRQSYPIDFGLFDADHHYALYIDDDPTGQQLTLEVQNASTQTIQFGAGQDQTASAQNYHFELRFRQGVLSTNTLTMLRDPQAKNQILSDTADWDLYVPATPDIAGQVSLYLLYKGSSTQWPPAERRSLILQHFSAAAAGGARGTRVELSPHQLTFAGDTTTPLTGSRTRHLSIINLLGQKYIPLHVGFVGSNRILNDGSSSEYNALHLRITNTDSPPDGAVLDLSKGAELTLSVETGELDKEWALTTPDAAKAIRVTVKRGNDWEEVPTAGGDQAASPKWKIAGTLLPVGKLAPGEHLEIKLAKITTLHPIGPANLYLRYRNIPGYLVGQFVLTIEKSPLLFLDQYVGIGIANPQSPLHVKGEVHIDGQLETDRQFKILVDYPWSDHNRTLLELQPNYQNDANRSRVLLYAPNSYYTNEPAITLAGNYGAGAKVGIGTTDPQSPLHIKGDMLVEGEMRVNGQLETDRQFKLRVDQSDYPWPEYNRTVLELEPNYQNDPVRSRVFLYAPNNYYHNEPAITLAANYGGGAKVGIGTGDPVSPLHVVGAGLIGEGHNFATGAGYMAAGSLTIGSTTTNYGGGTLWNGNTAGLLLETTANTEIAVHDSNTRLASLMYYEGDDANRITIGRDMGWGKINTLALNGRVGIGTLAPSAQLQVVGNIIVTGMVYCVGGIAVYTGAPGHGFIVGPGGVGIMPANGWSQYRQGTWQEAWGPEKQPDGEWVFTPVPR